MNTAHLPASTPTPALPADPCPRHEAPDDGETFARLLEEQTAPDRPAARSGEVAPADREAVEDVPSESDEAEPAPTPAPPLAIQVPLLPYHPIVELRLPMLDGSLVEAGGEEGLQSAAAPVQTPPAQVLSAGNSFPSDAPILTALFPTSVAQIHAQLGSTAREPDSAEFLSTRGVQLPPPQRPPVPIAPPSIAAAPQMDGAPGNLAVESALPVANEETPALPGTARNGEGQLLPNPAILAPAASAPPALATGEIVQPKQISPGPVKAALSIPPHSAAPGAASLSPAVEGEPAPVETAEANAPQKPNGIPAAKRGDAMQDATLELPVTVPPANSAGAPPVRAERTPAQRAAESLLTISPASESRSAALPIARTEPREQGEREAAGRQAEGATPREFEAALPSNFSTMKPHFEVPRTEAPNSVGSEAQLTRTEVVQLAERTADAALRMRAIGQERVEVAVQLASGDRVTIQLRMANGEVTPIIRANSEALRTALEQNWAGFSERTADRGVRLTPPVFDVNSSSSNMTDLSQQRHGRDTAFTDPQGELFRHLPPRIRPPRVLAPGAVAPATAADGVRLYA